MKRMPKMKIKAGVWHWMALACTACGLVLGLGMEGDAQTVGEVSDAQFAVTLAVVLAAVLFMRLGFAAQEREQREEARRRRLRRYAQEQKNADKNRHTA